MTIFYTLCFIITFYFTIVRLFFSIKIFNLNLNNFPTALGIKQNRLTVIINWAMWFFQIYFWFNYFNIKIII